MGSCRRSNTQRWKPSGFVLNRACRPMRALRLEESLYCFRRYSGLVAFVMFVSYPLVEDERIVYTMSIYCFKLGWWRLRMDTAKLFENGKSQAVRLPKEYRFRGNKVYIKKLGNAVVLIPEQDSWQSLVESVDLFSDDFMVERVQPETQDRDQPFE